MYNKLLQTHPLKTKSITSGVIFSLGDIIAQKLVEKKEEMNWKRNLTLVLTGTYYLGPCLHFWYSKFLPKISGAILPATAGKYARAGVGMFFDQVMFAPVFLFGFFIVNSFNETFTMKGAERGVQAAKSKLWQTLQTNWKIWPAATMINLSFVPSPYQVLFANFIGLFWNIYLSLMTNS